MKNNKVFAMLKKFDLTSFAISKLGKNDVVLFTFGEVYEMDSPMDSSIINEAHVDLTVRLVFPCHAQYGDLGALRSKLELLNAIHNSAMKTNLVTGLTKLKNLGMRIDQYLAREENRLR